MPLFISDEELSRLSGDTTAVAAKADAYIRGLLNELDTVRAKADASDINAEQNCSLVEQKYLSLSSEFSKLESHAASLQSSLDQHLRDLSDSQAKNHQFHLQLVEKDREIERLKTELSELHKSKRQLIGVNEQKDLEISEKNTTIRSYLDKIVHLTENAAQKEARFSEVEAELGRCRAACTRLQQEKEIVERQNAWLNEELTAKINSFLELRRKHTESETDISSKLADVERQFSECFKSLQWNKDRVRELEMKLKSMQEELISAKDSAAANEEQLSAELSTVNKLNELYKESSEEWSRKAADLEGVIKAMESHLKQVEDDYKDRLEKEFSARKLFEKEAADLKEKLQKCEADIERTKKMNELSNLQLTSFSTEPWLTPIVADNMDVENNALISKIPVGVSGTALAATLLRDGWSLAKMYAKYQEAVDALRHEQLGRKESEGILQRVLYELEEKAEAIEDERVEHEKMADAYSLMNQKLQNSLNENSNLEKTILELKADLKRHEREYNLAHKEVDDLRKQVTILLKECQDIQVRCGSFGNNINVNVTNTSLRTSTNSEADGVISEHLLTFKDINGLVEQNVQLRSLVRSLSGQLENQEVEFKEKLEMELKKHTEEAASKVAVVLQRAEEQGQMIESLHTSVAMYKRLYEEEHSLHLSHTHSSEALAVAAEVGRNNMNTSNESSQEVSKKSLEKAAERVRCLEDDLAKSRSEIIVLRSERDKIAIEAKFVREQLDSFMKEFEHQNAEAKGILARNVEFSQLVVDYQRKLRESSESLNAAEEFSRKLSMELSALKSEKEVLSNAEKRASDEVRNLSERVYRLQGTLGTIQSAEEVREEARVAERVKQEEHTKQLEREWAEAKKELQEERENVRRLALDRDQTMKNSLRQVEDMGKELTNALGALASAESRAAVAEAKLSSLQKQMDSADGKLVNMDAVNGPSTVSRDEVVAELQTAKEEIEKLKEEVHANKAHMMQYKSIAEVNEDALKQIENAHEDYKIEVDNTKKSLEAEVHSLREKVSELEKESSLISEAVVSATAGKEEALTSALAELTNLKEEILSKTSQISEMEIQISGLKEHLDKEHQKWRSAQTNYERQVILQSETIQELTKTSEMLASLQEEASKLRKLADAQKIENNELKAKSEEEKARLEKSKYDAEKKYNEINEQNKILHSQLEALHIQWAEKERNATGISPGSSSDTFADAGLQNVVNYLRRSKEIAETEVSLLKQEKLRLQSQLEGALKAAESANASLEAQRVKSRSFMFTEEEFKSLQLQVREINLLRESNMQLREENKHNFEECQKLRELAEKARAEKDNLENLIRDREIELEGHKKEIETLKIEKEHLNHKVSELLERSKNVDVEDYDRVKKLVRDLQDKLRDRDAQIEDTGKILSKKHESMSRLEQNLSNCKLELLEKEKRINEFPKIEATLKQDAERNRKMQAHLKKRIDVLSREKEDLVKENQQLSRQLDEIKQVKRSTSDTTGEQGMNHEKDTRIQMLEKYVEKVKAELTKEKEDKSLEKNKRLKSEKAIMDSYNIVEHEKKQFLNELERHKEALKRLSDEVEKLKIIVGNIPEGTNVAQLLSGSIVDDISAPYISAVENFEKEAHAVFVEFGGRATLGDASTVPDSSATATGSLVHTHVPNILPLAAPVTSSLPLKATGDSEKRPGPTKSSVETRKIGRRLVRPRLVKPDEPQGDTEMSDVEVLGGNKPGPSIDTETQSDFASSSQPAARKRLAPISTSELREESVAPGEKSSDVIAPLLKKPKGSESPEKSGEEQPSTTPEFTSSQPVAEESFESGELPQGQNEEVSEAQNDDETDVGKDEDSKDPPHLDGTSQDELQADKTGISEENLDQPAETKMVSDEMQRDHTEIDNQQSTLPLNSETEEGELLQEAGDPEGGCDDENQESREATPEPSPARGDDDALEAGEINSPEVSSDDKNDEGDLVEDAADGSDKLVDNEPIAVESDPVAEAAPVVSESNLQSSVVESSPSKLPVSKQGTTSVPSKTEEVKPSSPISDMSSTTINIHERARQMAQLRQAGQAGTSVFTTAGRGRGRAPRGRLQRGRGRRPPSSDA
ncbi:unnamed protein product [Trifolium pratense]|uniref:Uncharacterized protein n=1 Tax=Trifolium pratense TaxID=57577 RepID=A0ACB0KQD8_TRIPR|nr:unnamed protein product [Trifolium pratense]